MKKIKITKVGHYSALISVCCLLAFIPSKCAFHAMFGDEEVDFVIEPKETHSNPCHEEKKEEIL